MKSWKTKSGHIVTQVLDKRCNVYLLSDDGKNILVDTDGKRDNRLLLSNLKSMRAASLDALIFTHTHFDHAQNAANILKKFGPKVIVHESEAQFLESGNSSLPRGTIVPTKVLLALVPNTVRRLVRYEPCKADILIDDSLALSDYGFNAHIIHTPGHTSGSLSVIVDDEIALVGDTMFGVVPWSVFPPFADDLTQLFSSWRRLLETGCHLFLPAHGSAISRARLEKCYRRKSKS